MSTINKSKKLSLTSYYTVPLLGITPTKVEGYVEAYLSVDKPEVIIELEIPNKILAKNPNFHVQIIAGKKKVSNICMVFNVPEIFHEDIIKIRKGKYSKISDLAKKEIRDKSGLVSNKVINGMVCSDKILLALDKSPVLKDSLEKELDVILDEDAELASILNEEDYWS